MIVIIDNQMGNIQSVYNAVERLGVHAIISNKKKDIMNASALIMPGVGAFPMGMKNLKQSKIDVLIKDVVLNNNTPFLGICLGMQLLFDCSEEQKATNGLGIIRGKVKKIKSNNIIMAPHVGWNKIDNMRNNPLFINIDENARFYFDHSYYVAEVDNNNNGTLQYGDVMIVSIYEKNIFGVQFHPEKSQRAGLKLLRNFINYSLKLC